MITKKELEMILSTLPYGTTDYVVRFEDNEIGIGIISHWAKDDNPGYFRIDASEYGIIEGKEYDEKLINIEDPRFNIIEIKRSHSYYDILSDIKIINRLNQKLVIMCVKSAEVNFITDILISNLNYVKITGNTPSEDREKLVNQFKTDMNCNILIGTVEVLKTGWDLSNTDWIIVIDKENKLTNSMIQQIIARGHRPGQKNFLNFRRYFKTYGLDMYDDQIIFPFKEDV